jgi:hypothetical protein
VKRKDGSEERMLEYSNQLGLTLLKMHRDTAVEAETEFTPESADEIRERLIKKLKRLKARNDAEDSADSTGDSAAGDAAARQCERGAAAPGL